MLPRSPSYATAAPSHAAAAALHVFPVEPRKKVQPLK